MGDGLMIYDVFCNKCDCKQQHAVHGTAYKSGGGFETEPGEWEANDDEETSILQCVVCKSISLWEMVDYPDTGLKPYHCLYKETSRRMKIDFSKFRITPRLTETLQDRVRAIEISYRGESWLTTILLAGSIVEGVLIAVFEKNRKTVMSSSYAQKIKDKSGKVKDFTEWTLEQMIHGAHELGFLDKDMKSQANVLRDFRNFVHPNKYEKETTATLSKANAEISIIAAEEISNQVQKHL